MKYCDLCLTEKTLIALGDPSTMLNKRTEIFMQIFMHLCICALHLCIALCIYIYIYADIMHTQIKIQVVTQRFQAPLRGIA